MFNILVIEDDSELRTNIYDLFLSEGYNVKCAEDGLSGIQQIREKAPDLVLCDLMMPNVDGYTVLEEIKKQPKTVEIPLIFLTAKTEQKYFRKGMRLGADDYILKPFDLDDLLESVRKRIEKREYEKQKISKAQEQIAAKISHELRTPLVSILGYANLAQEEDDTEEIRKMLKIVEKTAKNLHGKIEKFILYKDLVLRGSNDTGSAENNYTEINEKLLYSFLSKIDNKFKPIQRTKFNLENKTLRINKFYLEKLIQEIIENGLRYSDTEQEVFVNGYLSGEYYCIDVIDKGECISDEKINSLSNLKRLSENQYKEEGIGLGLPIAVKIIELFDGALEFDKTNNCNTIRISIPIK